MKTLRSMVGDVIILGEKVYNMEDLYCHSFELVKNTLSYCLVNGDDI